MRPFDSRFSEQTRLVPIDEQIGLDPLGGDNYRSRFNQGNVYDALFGGQVIGQALSAANRTVDDGRSVHSCHCYFLRAGRNDRPVDYHVDRVRDGRRFSSRHIDVTQDGKLLLTMDCSYRVPLPGFEHQAAPVQDLDPESAMSCEEFIASADPDHRAFLTAFFAHYPIEMRIPSLDGFLRPGTEHRRHYWLRGRFPIASDDPRVHEAVFAYMSDFMFVGVPLSTHSIAFPGAHLSFASLDHAIWFHRPVRSDEWLLLETDSPSAHGGVNLARGLVYDRAGRLVASLPQEGLHLVTGGQFPQ